MKEEKGITLIALVVTIVVLLILAGTSIAMLAGDNGIIEQAKNAKTETTHKGVYEAIELKAAEYTTEKQTGKYTKTLIDYLTDKEIISTKGGIDGYIINVEKLMGEKQRYGNGTDGKTDVYKLEESTSGMSSLKKVADIGDLKIAEASKNKTYKVLYCETEDKKIEIGIIEESVQEPPREKISFTIGDDEFEAESGMTWNDWVGSSYKKEVEYSYGPYEITVDVNGQVKLVSRGENSNWHGFIYLQPDSADKVMEKGTDYIKANGQYMITLYN